MKKRTWSLPCCLTCLAVAAAAPASTYYVDFAGGDDDADGRSPLTPWKHAPGDANATEGPAAAELSPGDTVCFRGGVTYHGSITLTRSGAADNRITLDGNTAGTFGDGPAVLDGGRVITGWQRCGNADESGGNPRWKDIFYADVDLDISRNFSHGEVVLHRQVPPDKMAPWQRVILYDGERRLLPISQYPKPADPFYPDLPRDYLLSPNRLEVREADGVSVITDEENLVQQDANYYDGMFVGVHGGNNHVYFAAVTGFDPASHQLRFARFKASTYPTTRYALYNAVRLIDAPGEWAVETLDGGKSRFYLLADRLVDGRPDNIGFPELQTGITIAGGASHIAIRGFLIQRYSGGGGGISVSRNTPRAQDIVVSDCEIRFVSGHAGVGPHYCDGLVVKNCFVHHCPSWTTGVFLNRVNDYVIRSCRLEKNSGSGIRHYECKRGRIEDNAILDHYGMHSSTINVYEGCADIVIERNYLHNVIAINRNAENIIFRNNVVDSQNRAAVNVAMWTSGRVGGRNIRNLLFERNTFVNANRDTSWSTAIFVQTGRGATPPEGLVIRDNILDRLRPPVPGTIERNLFMRATDAKVAGSGGIVADDHALLFLDAAGGDFRRRPGGPMMEAGADIPPPAPAWRR
ncbi:MAG: right-handed parallel beta-helix repeat-containing protein [Phycisphaerae bacterium]|nr:right-handed parallel beta-helix repeat-containing protein [Phycisphaerae bacterium]